MAEVPAFDYLARRGDGERVRGRLRASSLDAAVALVRERALVPVRVREAGAHGVLTLPLRRLLRSSSQKSRVGFIHAFATMVRAGVPVLRILEVLEEEASDAHVLRSIASIRAALVRGEPLSHALAASSMLAPVHLAMIGAGETGGVLDEALQRVAAGISREHALQRRVLASLAYPALLIAAAVVSIAFLVGTLAPALSTLFAEMNAPLPAPTRVLLAVGGAWHAPATLAALVLAAASAAVAARTLLRRPRAVAVAERFALRLPVVGALRRALVVARVARSLAALLRSGVATLAAVDLTAAASGSPAAAQALERLRGSLREGESFGHRLAAGGFFPPLFVQMVRVGEESGTVDALLDAVADFYEVEAEAALHALTTLIEPVLIALLGGVVAAIALAVFIPLYALIGSLR